MNVTYKKDINHTYILFQGERVSTETFQVQMLLHNLVEGLLPCSMTSLNDEEVWRCECTGLPSLDVYCKTKELKKEDFIWVVHQLLENIQEIQDYLLDVDTLYLLPEYIYIHPEKNRILCCLVPFYHKDVWSSLKQVLQFLLQYLDQTDDGAASMAYGLFRMLSREDCSMELLWAFLYEKEHSWKKRGSFTEIDFIETDEPMKQASIKDWTKQNEKEDDAEYIKKQKLEHPNVGKIQDKRRQTMEQQKLIQEDGKEDRKDVSCAKEAKGILALWEEIKDVRFWKKIAYLFPALAAIVLFLYLAFHSWTMSGERLLVFAGLIVGFQLLSLLLYWLWGRQEKEINPLADAYASGNMRSEEDLIDAVYESGTAKKNQEHWSEEFEKKLFGNRFYGFSKDDGCTVLLTEIQNKKLSLVRVDGGKRYELQDGETLIGKSKERAQILLTEAAVSRIHAMLIKRQETYYLQDLNSKNGTYLNGERLSIRTNYPVKEGDEITIANVRFTLS